MRFIDPKPSNAPFRPRTPAEMADDEILHRIEMYSRDEAAGRLGLLGQKMLPIFRAEAARRGL